MQIVVSNMRQKPAPQHGQEDSAPAGGADIRLASLLYRFLFFDWLFADMTEAKSLFARHAAWQHNHEMGRHLPIYLLRWSVLTILAFGLGCLFDRILESSVAAACFFIVSSMTLAVMLVILALWVFLSNPEMP